MTEDGSLFWRLTGAPGPHDVALNEDLREEIGMNALCKSSFIIHVSMRMDDVTSHSSRVVSLNSRTSSAKRCVVPIAKMASTSMGLPGACKLHAAHATALASCSTTSPPSAYFRHSISSFGRALEAQFGTQLQGCSQRRGWRRPGPVVVRAEEVKEVTQAKGLSRETGGQWLSCTTRHIRIYAGYVDPVTKVMDQSQLDKLTLMLDPDNEFEWPEEAVQKVYNQYSELVETYAGADLTEYTLRLIGSDLEHYIRKLLLAGELKYNLDCRVLNFSMGKPRLDPSELDDVEVEE